MDFTNPSSKQITSTENELLTARKSSLADFGSIEHRLEFVEEINGIEYINDSKATDVNSTWYSLESMEKPVVWILGTSELDDDYALFGEIATDKVRAIVCLGQCNDALLKEFEGRVSVIKNATTVEEAVAVSAVTANEGDVVLFSPACSGFDLFQNYKDRGQQFVKAIHNLSR